jgi:hypothetical protein
MGKLKDKTLDLEARCGCLVTAADCISVCHELLEPETIDAALTEIFGCLSNENLQESCLKALTLIALH